MEIFKFHTQKRKNIFNYYFNVKKNICKYFCDTFLFSGFFNEQKVQKNNLFLI